MSLASEILAFGLSTTHIVIFLAIILLLFGGKKLPELARGIGKGLRIFRDEMHGLQREIEEPPATTTPPPPEEKPAVQANATEKK